MSNTLKTVIGFLRSIIERRVPMMSRNASLDEIYNYLSIDNLFATSGQPSEEQFGLIRNAGYETVVNLAPVTGLPLGI